MIIFYKELINPLGVLSLNKKAAFFASILVAIVSLLSSFYVYPLYGFTGASITVIGAIIWVGLGFYFKNSKS